MNLADYYQTIAGTGQGTGLEERYDKDSNGFINYYGIAPLNTPTSSPAWFIIAYTNDSSGFTTRNRFFPPNQIWDNRALL